MRKFEHLEGKAAGLPWDNIDTDQILPKQFLKVIERTGLASALFFDARYDSEGKPDPEFILNRPETSGVAILIVGENFGCGSSREHAVWALAEFGIRCIIGPSFAEIFATNCTNNGVLLVKLPARQVAALQQEAKLGSGLFAVNLPSQRVTAPSGKVFKFEIDTRLKRKLLTGADMIAETLAYQRDITAYEERRSTRTLKRRLHPGAQGRAE